MALQCNKCGRLKSKTGTHTCPTSSWNKGLKNVQVAWNKGGKAKESTKLKLSETRKKKIASGKIQKPDGKLNGMYGKKPWNKGKKVGVSPKKGTKVSLEIRLKNSGVNNYRWQGGINSINQKLRKCYEYRQWTQDVLKRDNYSCQECGVANGKLEVHHIKQFALLLRQFNVVSLEQGTACYQLWDYDNAITLCKPCHKKTDSYLKHPKL